MFELSKRGYSMEHTSIKINQPYSISNNQNKQTMTTKLSNQIYRKDLKGIEIALEIIKNLKMDGDTVTSNQSLGC